MNIHEYQAKQILRKYGVATPEGIMAESVPAAVTAFKQLGTPVVAIKAQVHAGGRGKAGGVKICKSEADVESFVNGILGTNLVTHQTDSKGQPVHKVYVEAGSNIDKEFYLAVLLDRASSRNIVMASTEGGMDIEEVAEKTPEKIFKEQIDPAVGMMPYQARNIAFALGLEGNAFKNAVKFILNCYQAYLDTDAAMLEINPLVLTKEQDILALDCKMNFDGNALFRHQDIHEMDDTTQQDPKEVEAQAWELNYVALEGNIACMVNGAGLAMATMDIIKHYGGEPANFLDVGGTADVPRVTAAFKLILSDKNVKGIFVNILGGIVRCDVIAEGIVEAAKAVKLDIPLVVRLAGTNVEQGKEILNKSGLPITPADKLGEAAEAIVAAVKKHAKAA